MISRLKSYVWLLTLILSPLIAHAQPTAAASQSGRATVTAALSCSALQPGQPFALAIVIDIKPGFHAQSAKPLDKDLIPMTVALEPNAAAVVGNPIYPEGRIETYPALGRISVYTGKVIVHLPIRVKDDAAPGATNIAGSVRYQICDDRTCFAPETTKFSVDTRIVPSDQGVLAANAELFTEFDPRAFASIGTGAATQPMTRPATAPAASAASEPPVAVVSIFGWHVELRQDSRAAALLVAFLAGIIFNVMPCVLPVLPLKALSFYEVAQHSRGRCLALAVVFSLGIVAVFGALAVVVVAMKLIVWGEMFAQAWFTWTIVAILVVMALGMFGAFTVALPTAIYSITPRHDTYTGNFLFGMLTAVLSTPCTAPLFPPLLLWASSQPTLLAVLGVLMVGVGMAFPYVVLSAFPQLARNFPRTGAWAELVKQMMGFLLLAAAAYFGGRAIDSWRWLLVAGAGRHGMGKPVSGDSIGAGGTFGGRPNARDGHRGGDVRRSALVGPRGRQG